MKRLLITGTSHVAALKAGWETITDRPAGLEVEFLAANSTEFPYFTLNAEGVFGFHQANKRSPKQVELARAVSGKLLQKVSDFSHVLICGQNFGQFQLLRLLGSYRIDGLREPDTSWPYLSDAAYRAFCLALALAPQEFPHDLVPGFAKLCKVGVSPSPRRNEAILTDPDANPWFKVIGQFPDGMAEAMALADAEIAQACAERGATHFAPPANCLTEHGFTKAEYSRGFVRISGTNPVDHSHVNATYGAIRLRAILDWALA